MGKTKTKKPAWWISWYHPRSLGAFELHSPWWISGLADRGRTIVAAVRAKDEDAAYELIYAAYDERPKHIEFRFCQVLNGSPFTDRFPKADWMKW